MTMFVLQLGLLVLTQNAPPPPPVPAPTQSANRSSSSGEEVIAAYAMVGSWRIEKTNIGCHMIRDYPDGGQFQMYYGSRGASPVVTVSSPQWKISGASKNRKLVGTTEGQPDWRVKDDLWYKSSEQTGETGTIIFSIDFGSLFDRMLFDQDYILAPDNAVPVKFGMTDAAEASTQTARCADERHSERLEE